ncbi:MAG: hypothetical protein EOO24_66975, partial [Comamonadaceae bacterium]
MADQFDADAAVRSFLAGTAPTPETALRTTLYDAVDQKPDYEAELRRIAASTGVPLDTARAMPDELRKQATLATLDTSAVARMSPVTASFLTDPQNAAIAHDDIGRMGLLETLANSFRRGVPALQQIGAATALRGNVQALADFDRVAGMLDAGAQPASIPQADDPLGVAWMSPEQRARYRESILTPLGDNVVSVVQRQKERQAIPSPDVVAQVMKAETFGQAWSAFTSDPVQFIAAIGPESLVANAPGLIAAVPAGLLAGPAGAAAAMGAGSFGTDFGSSIVEALGRAGVNVADTQSLYDAVRDEGLM